MLVIVLDISMCVDDKESMHILPLLTISIFYTLTPLYTNIFCTVYYLFIFVCSSLCIGPTIVTF